MKSSNKLFIVSLISFVVFLVFTILVMSVDVQPIGPENSKVGLAFINKNIFEKLGTSSLAKIISEIIGYISLLLALSFCILFVVKLIKGKSIKNADKKLFALCVFYAIVGIVYVLFLLIKINYRPVLVDGKLEASYPSSHTILMCSILVSAVFYLDYITKNVKLKRTLQILLILATVIGVVCRMLSGVHWFTDIIAGIILSGALITSLLGANLLINRE